MPHRQEILKAANQLVAAQKLSLATGGIVDSALFTLESEGEESEEDAQFLRDQPSLLHTPAVDVLSLDG